MKAWRYLPLEELGKITSSKRIFQKEYVSSGVPFYRTKEIKELANKQKVTTELYISKNRFNEIKQKFGTPSIGDILITAIGTIGEIYVVDTKDDFYFKDGNVLWLRDFQDTDPFFLKYSLISLLNELNNLSSGSTYKALPIEKLKKHKIYLPPLKEQQRIVAILDKADAIRRKRKQAIRLTEELLRSLFLDMFGEPVTNPKGWKIDELGKYISHSNNGLSRRRKTFENKGNIVLRLQDVRAGYIVFDEPNRIKLDEKEKQRYLLEAGDLLFIRVNGNKEYVGRCAVYKGFHENVYHNDHLIRIQTQPEIESDYLAFIFNHSSGKTLLKNKIKTSAGQYTVSQQGIESIKIPIPPHNLQVKYVQHLQLLKKQRDKHLLLLDNSENLFNSLLQKAFRGEL